MIKSSAHSSTFLAGNLTNRVFPLASYSAAFARQSNPSFVLQRWRRRRRRRRVSASSCYTCAVSGPPSCFILLHVQHFHSTRCTLIVLPFCGCRSTGSSLLLLLVVVAVGVSIGSTAIVADSVASCLAHANCSAVARPVSWHLSLKGVECLAANSLCSLAWRLWLWRFVADSFALVHFL